MPFKVRENFRVGPSPRKNNLPPIPHHAYVLRLRREQAHQFVLHIIKVLVFIHEDVGIFFLIACEHLRARPEERHDFFNQIVKIKRVLVFKFLLVSAIGVNKFFIVSKFFVISAEAEIQVQYDILGIWIPAFAGMTIFSPIHAVFHVRDARCKMRRPLRRTPASHAFCKDQPQLLHHFFHHLERVVIVKNDKRGRPAEMPALFP